MAEPEIITDPIPAGGSEQAEGDVLDKPVSEIIFAGFRNEVNRRFEEIEKFLDALKQQESAKIRDIALDIPVDVKIGRKTYKLHRLPAGYRVLMMEKLRRIAELVPQQDATPAERLAQVLMNKDEKTPEELAEELLEATRQPGLLAQMAPHVPEIFDLMLEIIQLAFQAGRGKPEFDENGRLKDPVVDLDTLRWECEDIEGLFNRIIEMNLPIFFTIQSVRRSLMI